MSVHKIIRAGLERLKLNEQAFAGLLGVTRGTVQQWEKKGGTAPNCKRQPAVAALLDITVSELMCHSDSTSTTISTTKEKPLSLDDAVRVVAKHLLPLDGTLPYVVRRCCWLTWATIRPSTPVWHSFCCK